MLSVPSVVSASVCRQRACAAPETDRRYCETRDTVRSSEMKIHSLQRARRALLSVVLLAPSFTLAQDAPSARPWQAKSLSPDRRAMLLLAAMTPAEKFQQI